MVCSRGFANEKSAKEHAGSDLHKNKVQVSNTECYGDCVSVAMVVVLTSELQDEEVTLSLSELVSPSDEHVSCITDLVELVFQQQSAQDGNLKKREEVADELRVLVQKEFPGNSAWSVLTTSKAAVEYFTCTLLQVCVCYE